MKSLNELIRLTTPTAKADEVLSHKHPAYHLPSEEAEVGLG